jgi:hypothetical protein
MFGLRSYLNLYQLEMRKDTPSDRQTMQARTNIQINDLD